MTWNLYYFWNAHFKLKFPLMHPSLEGENPSGWLEPDMTNIGISITDINVDPNDGVKRKFFLDILSLCETNKEKLLVSSQYLPPLTLLEKMLVVKKNWSKGSEILRLDGNTHVELEENINEQFNQDSDSKVLFASIRACGEGIFLTGASRVIILDTPWNPSIFLDRKSVGLTKFIRKGKYLHIA